MSLAKFLAFDFGAESGRAILGVLDGEKIVLEEIHRFPNVQIKESGHIHWNISNLFDELKKSLSSAANLGFKDLLSIGVDTWGVDFALYDNSGNKLSGVISVTSLKFRQIECLTISFIFEELKIGWTACL